jgi:hypothetical protein
MRMESKKMNRRNHSEYNNEYHPGGIFQDFDTVASCNQKEQT